MVVFPHINRKDYLDRGLNQVISLDRTLLAEDLEPAGELRADPSGKKFQARIAQAFPFPFNGLSGKEIQILIALIYPILKFEPPKRHGSCKDRFQREIEALDEDQSRAALSLKAGHQLVKGPPGCGKTLVLIHRCGFLRKYRPGMKRILLVCYNIALASYLKRLLQEKGIGVGEDGIQVAHFYEICQKVLGMKVEFDNPDPGYYETILQLAQEALGNNPPEAIAYDALLVDEGQDFRDDMLKILLALLRPGGELVIALDPYQDLYRKDSTWRSIGIEARGTRQLKRVYRNTREIARFARRFIGGESQEAPQLELFQTNPSCSGPQPEILWFESQEKIDDYLIRDILDLLHRGEYRRSEIGILYDDKVYGADRFQYQGKEAPSRLYQKLETAGIPTKWVSEDVRAKELFDITTDRVSLISIHSAKGLDFDLVYLVGVDRFIPTDETRDRLIRLLYVAVTRAKYRLVVPYVEEMELIVHLETCLIDS
jgi:superfamily I DNA and RNA helicase